MRSQRNFFRHFRHAVVKRRILASGGLAHPSNLLDNAVHLHRAHRAVRAAGVALGNKQARHIGQGDLVDLICRRLDFAHAVLDRRKRARIRHGQIV